MKRALILIGFLLAARTAQAAPDYYASPSGSGSSCTLGVPCAIDTLLFAAGAGLNTTGQCANLWLRGGTYSTGIHQKLFQGIDPGSASCHATVRSYPGEQATIDCSMDKSTVAYSNSCFNMDNNSTAKLKHVWYMNLDFNNTVANNRWTTDELDPQNRTEGVTFYCDGCKLINSTIRNTSQGMLRTQVTNDVLTDGVETYGNLVYYNGFDSPDRGHGHGFYWQTSVGQVQARSVSRADTIFNNFGFNWHFYNTGAADNYLTIDKGVAMDAGLMTQIGQPGKCNFLLGSEGGTSGPNCNSTKAPTDPLIQNSISFFRAGGGKGFDIGDSKGCNGTIRALNNYALMPNAASDIAFQLGYPCGVINVQGNTWIGQLNGAGNALNLPCNGVPPSPGGSTFNISGNTCSSTVPSSGQVITYEPNAYEVGRSRITVINYDLSPTVTINLASAGGFNGQKWKLVSAQDFYMTGANAANQSTGAPVASGTCGSPCTTAVVNTSGLTVEVPAGNRGNPGHIGEAMTAPAETGPLFNVYILLVDVGGANTPTPTSTFTPSFTATATPTPSNTPTPVINTPTAAATNTPVATATQTFTASQTPTLTPTPAVSSGSFFFKDCALTAPMVATADATVSGGFYVSSPTANSGIVTCTFSVPTTGTYYPWVFKSSDATNADSMFISLDGASDAAEVFDTNESLICATCTISKQVDPTGLYSWIRVNDRTQLGCPSCGASVGQPWYWSLTAGTHTVAFRQREVNAGDGARLVLMIVSSDPTFDPGSVGQPTPTPVPGLCFKWITCNGKRGRVTIPCSMRPTIIKPCPWPK